MLRREQLRLDLEKENWAPIIKWLEWGIKTRKREMKAKAELLDTLKAYTGKVKKYARGGYLIHGRALLGFRIFVDRYLDRHMEREDR